MKALISTDSSCLINYEMHKKLGISVFPLNVIIDGEEFLDGVTINQEQLCLAMRSNKNIKTSTPPLGEIIEYFEKLFAEGYDKIIHFTISSKLSSMNDLFNNVAKTHFDGKLFIIDSYSVSTTMLSQVLYAYEMLNKGYECEKIVEMLKERGVDGSVVFIPENLTALKNGGRISPAVALIGNTIGIKPVISLTDGALVKEGVTRHARKTFGEKINEVLSKFNSDEYDYFVAVFDGKEELVNYVVKTLSEKIGEENVITGSTPINVCAHCGPGMVGLLVTKKIDGKSIKDFM